MNSWERLENTISGKETDRTPILGGWISCPEHICKITGTNLDTYWENPRKVSADAYSILRTDGLISINVPKNRDDFRIVDANTYARTDNGMTLDDVLSWIEKSPEAAEIEEKFDFEDEYSRYRAGLEEGRALCKDMVYMPANWDAGSKITWYGNFGYENFFIVIGSYPDHAKKLVEIGGARGYCQCRLVAQAVLDRLYPHAILFGEDICSQQGPMISPAFMEKYYAPKLKRSLRLLTEVGCKPVWHSDGNIRPLVDMLIDCGIQGFQGFQPECGMTLEYVIDHKTKEGKPLVIFGPLAVTTELPVLSPPEIKNRVRQAIEMCKGKARLAIFTSNTINPDVPLENVYAMYEAVLEG